MLWNFSAVRHGFHIFLSQVSEIFLTIISRVGFMMCVSLWCLAANTSAPNNNPPKKSAFESIAPPSFGERENMRMVFAAKLLRFLLSCSALLILTSLAFAQQADTQQPDVNYRLHKGDRLSIKFLFHPELSEPTLVVRPDGFITLQMINDVKAEGLTAAELKEKLERAYNESLLNPVISVGVLEFVAPRVYVSGQVGRPNSYALREGDTLSQVIALAGGFTRDAHRKMVLLARPTSNREFLVRQVDMLELMSRKSGMRDEVLQDGDYIFVPDSKLSKFTHVIDAFRFAMPGFGIRY